MNKLKVIGTQKIGDFEFVAIEGGFGEGKKAMTVKDIAVIHKKEVKHVNEAITNNINRFKFGIDIIDILGVDQIGPKDFGYSQQAINSYVGLRNKGFKVGIYILSERGYAKLLKMLEDDTAWEIYDQLVDNYFNMKAILDTSNLSPELQMFQGIFNAVARQELETKRLAAQMDNITEIVALNTTDWRRDCRKLVNKMAETQGGYGAYQEIQTAIYEEVDRRAGSSLKTRLTNLRNRMAGEGVSKSKRDKTNKLDVIESDKRLKQIYLAVVKDFAIKYGVWKDQ